MIEVGEQRLMPPKHQKPVPENPKAKQKLCPVCGEPSYSAAGIHPQCATVQADEPRKERLKAEKKAEAEKKSHQFSQKPSWSKKCPSCGADIHVKKRFCICGADLTQEFDNPL